MRVGRMVNAVTTTTRSPAFKAHELRKETRMVEQLDAAAVDERQ